MVVQGKGGVENVLNGNVFNPAYYCDVDWQRAAFDGGVGAVVGGATAPLIYSSLTALPTVASNTASLAGRAATSTTSAIANGSRWVVANVTSFLSSSPRIASLLAKTGTAVAIADTVSDTVVMVRAINGNPQAQLDAVTAATTPVPVTWTRAWEQRPFTRGVEIENLLGRTDDLVANYPVIDIFDNGTIISIKSIDTSANSYQRVSRLRYTVRKYINSVAVWRGADWGGTLITQNQITSREVWLAIPPNVNSNQLNLLKELQDWAYDDMDVTLSILTIPRYNGQYD